MLNFIFEFIPILLFLIAFKYADIYVATVVGIVATAIQVFLTRLLKGYFDKKQLVTLAVFVFFGGLTLYFHDPIFVKWKPTIVFWFFALALLVSQWFGRHSILERLLSSAASEKNKFTVTKEVWRRLTYAWIVFFFTLGAVNLYIAYSYSTEIWVNFKFYGILSAVLIFSLAQAIYLSRYFSAHEKPE